MSSLNVLQELVHEKFGIDAATLDPNASMREKGFDSLALVEFLFAIEDRCSHADVALSEGDVDGCTIECWLHGSAFDLRTGVPLSLPATVPVTVYPARVVGDGMTAVVEIDPTPTTVPAAAGRQIEES